MSKSPRQIALENGEKTYNGAPCKNCGTTLKDTNHYTCRKCHRERSIGKLYDNELMAKYRSKEKTKNRVNRWRKKRPEKVLEYRERYKERKKQYDKEHFNESRDRSLRKNYNISLQEYDQMLLDQENKCLICNIDQNKCKKNFAVDHDHETGKIRGLLCNRCNCGIGHFNDNVDLLREAISYLVGVQI